MKIGLKCIIGACSLALATSCSPDTSTADEGTSGSAVALDGQEPAVSQPAAQFDPAPQSRELAPLSDYATIQSPQELIGRLPPSERAVVQSYYAKYPAILDFVRHEQLAWMARNGYPMPEHILAANRLTDQELEDLYESGDVQAGFLYLDREIETALRDKPKDAKHLPPGDRVHLQKIADRMLLSGSPFSGYAYANYQYQVERDASAALAGYAWAAQQGDIRAAEAMARLSESADPMVSVLAFSQILDSVRTFKPALLRKKVDSMPPDFIQSGG